MNTELHDQLIKKGYKVIAATDEETVYENAAGEIAVNEE